MIRPSGRKPLQRKEMSEKELEELANALSKRHIVTLTEQIQHELRRYSGRKIHAAANYGVGCRSLLGLIDSSLVKSKTFAELSMENPGFHNAYLRMVYDLRNNFEFKI